jgi:hypothetical protein
MRGFSKVIWIFSHFVDLVLGIKCSHTPWNFIWRLFPRTSPNFFDLTSFVPRS